MIPRSIDVRVTLNGTLRRFLPDSHGSTTLRVPDGTTVAELVAGLGAADDVWLTAVNGEVAPVSTPLAAGDEVDCFEPLEGG